MKKHQHFLLFCIYVTSILLVFGCSALPYKPRYGISPFEWSKFNQEQRQSTVKTYFGEDSIIVGRIEIQNMEFDQLELSLCNNENCTDLLDNNALEANKYSSRNQFDFGGFKFQKAVGESEIFYGHKVKYFYKRAPKGQSFIKVVEPIPDDNQGIIFRFYIPEKKLINLGTLKIILGSVIKVRFFGRDTYNTRFDFIKDDRPIKAFEFRLPYTYEIFEASIIDIH